MALSIKPGVDFTNIHSRIVEALHKIDWVYSLFGKNAVITSARDGKHMARSLHFQGKALDLRTNYFNKVIRPRVQTKLQAELGADFDVVLEYDHIHIELDPAG